MQSRSENWLARTFGLFFATLFVIVTVFSLLAFNLSRQLTGSGAIIQAMRSQNIYRQIPGLIADQIAQTVRPCPDASEACEGEPATGNTTESAQDYLRLLSKSDWQIILAVLMPPDYVQSQTEGLVNQFYTYMNTNQPQLILEASLVEFKANLAGQPGAQAFTQMIHSHSACTTEQLQAMKAEIQNPGPQMEELILCQPPEGILAQFSAQIGAVLGQIASTIPDQLDLAAAAEADPGQAQALATLRQNYQTLNKLATYSPLISIGLLLLIGLAAIRSFRDLLAWWGIPFLVAGVLGILAALLFAPMLAQTINNALAGNQLTGSMAPSVVQTLDSLVRFVANRASLSVGIEAGVLTILGLAMTGIFYMTNL